MSTCGAALRKISIFILVIAAIVLVVRLSNTLGPIEDDREDYNESMDRHDDCYDSDCDTCDYLEELETSLNRRTTAAFMDALYSLVWVGIGCAMLYGIGEIAVNLCNVESYTASRRYGEKSASVMTAGSGLRSTVGTASTSYCTKCGSSLRPGAEFCSICGTSAKK